MTWIVRVTGRPEVRGTFENRQQALAFAAASARLHGEALVLDGDVLLGRIVATGAPVRLAYVRGERRRWKRLVIRRLDT